MFFLLFSLYDMNIPVLLSLKGNKIISITEEEYWSWDIKVDADMGLMKAGSTV